MGQFHLEILSILYLLPPGLLPTCLVNAVDPFDPYIGTGYWRKVPLASIHGRGQRRLFFCMLATG